MRFRVCVFLFLILLVLSRAALAEELSFAYAPDTVHPGKAERVTLRLPQGESVTVDVLDEAGASVLTLRENLTVDGGSLTLTFNGMDGQEPLPQGRYTLRAQAGGQSATAAFSVSSAAPKILSAKAGGRWVRDGYTLTLDYNVSADGTLSGLLIGPDGSAQPVFNTAVQAGAHQTAQTGVPGTGGACTLSLTLTDKSGVSGNTYQLSLDLEPPVTPKPQPTIRPSALADTTQPGDFWSMEVGNYDWKAIWQVMISPMTVVKGSGKQAERQTYKLRAEPDAKSSAIGLITCETQGVHVLETLENGWTKVELYNSSYGEAYRSAGKGGGYGKTDELLQGYVETSRLGTFTPRTEYGLLIDKMTQELYIVTEKGLLSTLLVSTGFPTREQPWNETPAGEFYLSSKVGDFPSGNLMCSYGMRFNNGDILHQVPYIYNEKYDLKDFSTCEKYLGEKASHGCVRVQRKANEDGVNMKWIWDNVPIRTKLLIWDDDNRPEPFMEYPVSADTPIYYNPNGGQYYHADQNCRSIKDRFLPLQGIITYAELDDPQYDKLTPCKHCDPPEMRMRDIDALNRENGY